MDRVYLVGRLQADPNGEEQLTDWELVALESINADAVELCTTPLHFVMTFERGQKFEGGWIDMFFPIVEEEDSIQVELPL
jgi:hypothetical protein